jgi:hypothetical protein
VDTRDDEVETAQQAGCLVERAVVEDVDLDSGEDPERRHLVVQRRDDVELLLQPLCGQPARHLQPGRVVGEHDVLVAEVAGRLRHLGDGRAAVGPVRVQVAVAAQRREQVDRHLAAQRLGDAPGRDVAYAGQLAQRPRFRAVGELVGRQLLGPCCRRPERPYPERRLVGAFEQERDAAQVGHRIP